MMCTLYVHSNLLQADDFKKRVQQEDEIERRVTEWFDSRDRNQNSPIFEDEQMTMNKQALKAASVTNQAQSDRDRKSAMDKDIKAMKGQTASDKQYL